MIKEDFSPTQQAGLDYQAGCGQSDNPFSKGTQDYDEWAWEMHRLLNLEFKAERQQFYQ
jgi:hypothetical protein